MTSRRREYREGPRRLYKDSERGVLLGVCAGVAEFFDFQVNMVRLVTLLSLLIFTIPTLLTYFLLSWLLKDKPLSYHGPDDDWYFREKEFWRRSSKRRYRY